MAWAFAVSGVLAGLAQAGLLWRTATFRDRGWGFALRFVLVGAVLIGASLMGGLLSAAGGWGVGFAVGVVAISKRTSR